MKVREVITYKNYFEDFFKEQPRKVQDKLIKVLKRKHRKLHQKKLNEH